MGQDGPGCVQPGMERRAVDVQGPQAVIGFQARLIDFVAARIEKLGPVPGIAVFRLGHGQIEDRLADTMPGGLKALAEESSAGQDAPPCRDPQA